MYSIECARGGDEAFEVWDGAGSLNFGNFGLLVVRTRFATRLLRA